MWHLFPESFLTYWKDWEVRFLVLSSLLLQLILLLIGTRRKATPTAWIQLLVWTTYLVAESVPIASLGIISNWLSNLKAQSTTGALERKYELIALWAPMVLVHLGGPDSITAYSLEDNELWIRYSVRVSLQIGWTCYIYFLALSSSPLSYIAAAMTLAGILKNVERIISLYYASRAAFRDSLITHPTSFLLYPRIIEKLRLNMREGDVVALHNTLEIEDPESLSPPKHQILERPQGRNAFIAYQLIKIFRVLFADLIVNLESLKEIKSLFTNNMTSESAFKIIEIELNLMFESLHTKAIVIYKTWGKISKAATLLLSLVVLIAFCMVDKHIYELKLDLSITFMLILGLLLSEIYSILKVICSDRMNAWSMESKPGIGRRLIWCMQSRCQLGWLGLTTEKCRWSGTLSQYSILGFAVSKSLPTCSYNQKIKQICERRMQYKSVTYQPLGVSLRRWIYEYLVEAIEVLDDEGHPEYTSKRAWLSTYGATEKLNKLSLEAFTWSTEKDFSESIIIWHIATEILYYKDWKCIIHNSDIQTKCEISRTLSMYVIYLLVHKPTMLPIGGSDNYYVHTLLEAQKFFGARIPSHKSKNLGERIGLRKNYEHEADDQYCCKCETTEGQKNEEQKSTTKGTSEVKTHKSQEELDLCRICHMLLQQEEPCGLIMPPNLTESRGSQSVLFHASQLASQLKHLDSLDKRWKVIRIVWTEALLYSAYHSSGYEHSEQLSRGGEFLTHVWLLMAHFGISKQVKTSTKLAFTRMFRS